MAEAIQACERTPGQDTCPFHPGHKITSLCKTCGILVCLKCMTSKVHKKHEFKEISECLREPTNAIARYLRNMDKNLQITVDRELVAVKQERKERVQNHQNSVQSIKERGTNCKREIDRTTNDMVDQMDKHLTNVLDSLDKHVQVLESLRKYLAEERKECNKVLQDGSSILKFDIGIAVMDKADENKIPEPPKIHDLQHIKCDKSEDLIRKALGTLKELNCTSPSAMSQHSTEEPGPSADHSVPTQTTTDQKTAQTYSAITTQSTWINKGSNCQITPITNDTAWALSAITNQLHLISNTGQPLRGIQKDKDTMCLSVHPTTGQLYAGGWGWYDNTIWSIDTESGKTTVIVQCDFRPYNIKVTKDNHVLVGSHAYGYEYYPVCRYKLTGELVHTSPEKYNVQDIDQCTKTNRVVIACGGDGVTILNNNLTQIHTFTGLTGQTRQKFECTIALFDSFGNMIVGDYYNNEVYILDDNQFSLIQKVPVRDMSTPGKIKLYSNILSVQCDSSPSKVMCIELK